MAGPGPGVILAAELEEVREAMRQLDRAMAHAGWRANRRALIWQMVLKWAHEETVRALAAERDQGQGGG